ncbi:hypothetical protein AB0D58_34055 [Streptomyces sp. NPDC048210]|uniref:hypothetical protein n=1 Tax=Streptomyces sp. NPDC048210 TaxID=3156657 RepID=UPI00343B0BF6
MADVYRDPTLQQLQELHDQVVDALTALMDGISVPYGGLTKEDPAGTPAST